LNARLLTALAGAVAALAAGAIVVSSASCSQTPTNIPVRTFEQAQRVDFVCMAVNDVNGNPLPSSKLQPLAPDECVVAPSSLGLSSPYSTATFPNHLYAVVTQTTPGTLAVVDLTNGGVVDEDNSTPGINFIPVGANPTDVAVPQDGSMTFVTSAAPGKWAIYGIDNRHLLGTSTGNPPYPPLKLTDLPACELPQPPLALTIAPVQGGGFALVVMLGSAGNGGARIATYDPGPLLRGANVPSGVAGDGGASDGGVGAGDAGAAVDVPGHLPACTLLGNTLLADSTTLPATFVAGGVWPDGVPYVDGGVDLEAAAPPPAPVLEGGVSTCVAPPPAADAGLTLPFEKGAEPSPSAMVLDTDKNLLYVADGALPLIHVIDVSHPASPTEQAPLLATSVRDRLRQIKVGPLAISPPTRDYKRYLYAVDESESTLMVYDVTSPSPTVPQVPMQRPHAELNPFVEPDRIAFSAPVSAVTFVEHDWLLESQVDSQHYYSGVLCNPNPNAHPTESTFLAKGAYYRADQAGTIQNSGVVEDFPSRLRGIFAFVTLSNGAIVPIDVDDWDAPCRRPDPMGVPPSSQLLPDQRASVMGFNPTNPSNQSGVLDVPQEAPDAADLNEYHAPLTYRDGTDQTLKEKAAVTEEAFFPVSAPHRLRSGVLIEEDPNGANNMPHLAQTPQLFDQNGSPAQGTSLPLLQGTNTGFEDPSTLNNPAEPYPANRTLLPVLDGGALPNISVSYDDPTAHINQNWTVTYEGPLFSPIGPIELQTTDGYHTLIVTNGMYDSDAGPGPANGSPPPGFCAVGIEDWTIGTARAESAGVAAAAAWTSDYVEIADDLLLQNDPYWSEPQPACWAEIDKSLAPDQGPDKPVSSTVANARYTFCSGQYGAEGTDAGTSGTGTLADDYPTRDFPIVRAFDDHLVLGRFAWDPKGANGDQPGSRTVVGADGSNVPFLAAAQCCFHQQATFKVRTGGEWVTVGQNGIGLLHHVQVGPGGACVLSCSSYDELRNARGLDLSVSAPAKSGCTISSATMAAPLRNSAQAMRNPMFSFYIQPPSGNVASCNTHTLVPRDMQWQFTMTGGFSPISISLQGGTAAGVSPQSMKFIEPFGQMAIVDGAQQGLVIIDLNTLGFAHSPYY
jgi:hypothetical protein